MSSPCVPASSHTSHTAPHSSVIGALSKPAVRPQYVSNSPHSPFASGDGRGTGDGASSSRTLTAAAVESDLSPAINLKKRTSPNGQDSPPLHPGAEPCTTPASAGDPHTGVTALPGSTVADPSFEPPTSADSSTGMAPGLSPQKRQRPPDPVAKDLPSAYQLCPPADLVILISDMLSELVGLNDRIPLSGAGLTRFHSRAPPTISIPDYLHRLTVHATLQPSILLAMVYYIDILSTHYPPFVVSSLTVHRFLITAATVASKGLCDTFLTNGYYARVGGLSIMELNMLELEFLVRVGWRIVPKPEVLGEYYKSLVGRLGERYRIQDDEGG